LQSPLRDALVGAHLEIESDASARERRARHPGTRVRNAEIDRSAVSALYEAARREPRLSGGECGRWREARFRALREQHFARMHAPSEQPRERVQRERNPGEACMRGSAARAEREAPRVREPRGEGARSSLRPLTAEVGLI